MPYRKSFKKSYGRKKTPWYSKKYSAMQIASKAWKAAKYVKSLVNVERKFNDSDLSGQMLTIGGINWLTNIAEGTDYNQRDGLSVKHTSIFFQANLTLEGTAPTPVNTRMIMFRDLDNTGTLPVVTDVLEVASVVSPVNHTNGKRFEIIFDKHYSLSPNGKECLPVKFYKGCQCHIRWSDSTSGTREGHVYLLVIADADSAASFVTLNFYNRNRYVDN